MYKLRFLLISNKTYFNGTTEKCNDNLKMKSILHYRIEAARGTNIENDFYWLYYVCARVHRITLALQGQGIGDPEQ